MVQHYILHKGYLCRVAENTPINDYEHVDSLSGKLVAIMKSDTKTCFIFKTGNGEDDLFRLYLSTGQRPATRLLMLLCSQLAHIGANTVEIKSEKGEDEGFSWLRMSIPSLDVAGEAPTFIPVEEIYRNDERINLILTALGLVVGTDAPTDGSTTVAGLETTPRGLDDNDVRAIAIDNGSPVLVHIGCTSRARTLTEEGKAEFIKSRLADFCPYTDTIISRTLRTEAQRTAYIEGVKDSLAKSNRVVTVVTERELINNLLQVYATVAH